MAKKPKLEFAEKDLTKGDLRKLTALRKSLGDDIANKAFGEWLEAASVKTSAVDENALSIADALQPLILSGKIRIPRGGYLLRRGRGRVIVELPEYE